MAQYKNFYETFDEARHRLNRTIVLYNKEPVYIWCVTDHKGDGVFRLYISPIELVPDISTSGIPAQNLANGHPSFGVIMDEFIQANPKLEIQRKVMDSSLFNKFRPFPLGNVNSEGVCYYVERLPQRPKMEQGLSSGALYEVACTAEPGHSKNGFRSVNMFSKEFKDCILGRYPNPREVLEKIKSDIFINTSVGFHRNFALVKGPIDILFLAYKGEVVGALSNGDYSRLRLGKNYKYLKEAANELSLFNVIE